MPIRSHVDLVVFVRFMHVRGADVPRDAPTLLEGAADQDRYLRAWQATFEQTPHTVFHEGYHFWQGLRLPYLYWYAALAFRSAVLAFMKLSADTADHHDWESLAPALYRLQMAMRCYREADGSLSMSGSEAQPEDVVDETRLSPLDLLEAAASLAEFQAMNGSKAMADPRAFSRWRKRVPSYTRATRFVARVLDDEALALRCSLPLINASFTTTDPVRAFMVLLRIFRSSLDKSEMVQRFVAQDEPCQWPALFNAFLDDVPFEGPPDSTIEILDPPFVRLTLSHWLERGRSEKLLAHPVLAAAAQRWQGREIGDPGYSWMIDQPAWIDEERFWDAMNELGPPVTVVRFHLPDDVSRTFVITTEETQLDIRDVLALWSAVRRSAHVHFDPDVRICHHVECPEYGPNYCNAYPIIPEDFRKCGFPTRLERLRQDVKTVLLSERGDDGG